MERARWKVAGLVRQRQVHAEQRARQERGHLSRRNVCLQWLMRRIYARHQAREERDRLLSAARGAEVGEQERHNHSMNCL